MHPRFALFLMTFPSLAVAMMVRPLPPRVIIMLGFAACFSFVVGAVIPIRGILRRVDPRGPVSEYDTQLAREVGASPEYISELRKNAWSPLVPPQERSSLSHPVEVGEPTISGGSRAIEATSEADQADSGGNSFTFPVTEDGLRAHRIMRRSGCFDREGSTSSGPRDTDGGERAPQSDQGDPVLETVRTVRNWIEGQLEGLYAPRHSELVRDYWDGRFASRDFAEVLVNKYGMVAIDEWEVQVVDASIAEIRRHRAPLAISPCGCSQVLVVKPGASHA